MKRTPLKERFMSKVAISPDTGCWLWTASRRMGYGQIGVEGVPRYAHRVSWELYHGEIPDGLYVCHTCDTPRCVNPEHLFLGTALDNTRDSIKKGRSRGGNSVELEAERRGMTQKQLIRWALEETRNPNAAAKLLNLHRASILNAMQRHGLSLDVRVVEKEQS